MRRLLALICLAVAAAGCGKDSPTGPITVNATWGSDASQYRASNGITYVYVCPPNGAADDIWGTDVYTDDSSVCTAAVHAGEITLAGGGSVTIEIRAGAASYTGSTRNGVTSLSFGIWPGSFIFP